MQSDRSLKAAQPTSLALAACVAILGTGCGADPSASPEPQSKPSRAAAEFRFLRPPTVIFAAQRPNPESDLLRVYFRTNRALPRSRRGVRAGIDLQGETSDAIPELFTIDPKRHCYTTDIWEGGFIEDPRHGQRVAVGIRIHGRSTLVDRARVRARRVSLDSFDDPREEQRRVRKLGCRPERL